MCDRAVKPGAGKFPKQFGDFQTRKRRQTANYRRERSTISGGEQDNSGWGGGGGGSPKKGRGITAWAKSEGSDEPDVRTRER